MMKYFKKYASKYCASIKDKISKVTGIISIIIGTISYNFGEISRVAGIMSTNVGTTSHNVGKVAK